MPNNNSWLTIVILLVTPFLLGCDSEGEDSKIGEVKISTFADEEECDTSFTKSLGSFHGIGWRKGEQEKTDLEQFISGKKLLQTHTYHTRSENFHPDGRWTNLGSSGEWSLGQLTGTWSVGINDRGYPVLCKTVDSYSIPGPFCRDIVISSDGRLAMLSSNSTPSGGFPIFSYQVCQLDE